MRLVISTRNLFPTPVASVDTPDPEARNAELRALILERRPNQELVVLVVGTARLAFTGTLHFSTSTSTVLAGAAGASSAISQPRKTSPSAPASAAMRW